MQNCIDNTHPTVPTCKQGETLKVTARLYFDDEAVADWSGYKVSFMIYSPTKELLFSTGQEQAGVHAIDLHPDGTASFRIGGELTRDMLGTYYIEGKIAKDGETTVSDKTVAFTVIESRIGSTDRV